MSQGSGGKISPSSIGAEASANKDASGGYAGLTLLKINFRNALNTITSFFTNSNTAARTYTFQDRNGTIADDTDLGLKAAISHTHTVSQISDLTATAAELNALHNVKVYRALLSQTGTGAPTADEKQNTLSGALAWAYSGAGVYLGTRAGAFPAGKLFAPPFCYYNANIGQVLCISIGRFSNDVIEMVVTDNGGGPIELSDVDVPIEFYVYP